MQGGKQPHAYALLKDNPCHVEPETTQKYIERAQLLSKAPPAERSFPDLWSRCVGRDWGHYAHRLAHQPGAGIQWALSHRNPHPHPDLYPNQYLSPHRNTNHHAHPNSNSKPYTFWAG